ncbi:DUF429 domain-containing protein [Nibrella viscosa]|uniref:DUF429 domain-containing protein n=1 Tax=Nibrella viscosa TaxID=1084524 RepID=A0ABP8JW90_9BACT
MVIGLDGCRYGWIAACISDNDNLSFSLLAQLTDLPQLNEAGQILIDMPVGFADQQYRLCDIAARDLLRPFRHSSVFFTPHRDAVFASSYAEACRINRLRTGTAISVQTWHICGKIIEVDRYIAANPGIPLAESHPELCFYGLSGQACRHPKNTQPGISERLGIIASKEPQYRSTIGQAMHAIRKSAAKPDDILDAAVLAIIAKRNRLIVLPERTDGSDTPTITYGR